MGRNLLRLALLALLVWLAWAGWRYFSEGNRIQIDAAWAEANDQILRSVLSAVPDARIEFKTAQDSEERGFQLVTLDVVEGQRRTPFELYIGHDGASIHHHAYQLRGASQELLEWLHLDGAPGRGPASAAVTIVEYTDYTCPYCDQFHRTLEKGLFERFGRDVRLVIKQFPLVEMRSHAMAAARAASCAFRQGGEKYWLIHDQLFQKADSFEEDPSAAGSLGSAAGLDAQAFRTCVSQQETASAVQHDLKEGQGLGVIGTPSFFANGRPEMGIPSSADIFFKIVEEELTGKPKGLVEGFPKVIQQAEPPSSE